MAQEVLVYNPSTTPAIYADGRSIGGLEWLTVSVKYLDELLAAGCILIPEEGEPPVDLDPTPTDDSLLAFDEVSSEPDEPEAGDSDSEPTEQEPATSATPRRTRKSSSEKE